MTNVKLKHSTNKKGLAALLLIIIMVAITLTVSGGFAYWYYFHNTLTLREIYGKPQSPQAIIFINLLDFDTGLTRHDINHLRKRFPIWEEAQRQINNIPEPQMRNAENERLYAIMMEDKSFKKINRKLLGIGGKAVMSILEIAL